MEESRIVLSWENIEDENGNVESDVILLCSLFSKCLRKNVVLFFLRFCLVFLGYFFIL